MKEEKRYNGEDALLEKVRSGDNDAVAWLYQANFAPVYHFVINNSGDAGEAAEIYQQAFIIVYEKLQKPSFSLQSSIGTFIYAVGRNLWLAALKERRKFSVEASDDLNLMAEEDALDIQQILADEKNLEDMELSLELLGEPCRSLLKAFYYDMLSMEDIAKMMGYTNADNAKNQKYKCLVRLRRIFEKQNKKALKSI